MALILVVDDDEGIRRVVEVMLKNAGHVPVLAVNGNDALQQFRQQHFDLVICDVVMPDKEGIETLRGVATARSRSAHYHDVGRHGA